MTTNIQNKGMTFAAMEALNILTGKDAGPKFVELA